VNSANDTRAAQVAARRLGLEIVIVSASSANEIESAFATAVEHRATALQSGADAFLTSRREQMAALGLRHALPTIATFRESVEAGMLMSYGTVQGDTFREAGAYVGRILKGDKPADLPVVQPTKFELVINIKTAKALRLDVPAKLLALTDEVIE
jgi:putative ABC transport system substrate-binding protein